MDELNTWSLSCLLLCFVYFIECTSTLLLEALRLWAFVRQIYIEKKICASSPPFAWITLFYCSPQYYGEYAHPSDCQLTTYSMGLSYSDRQPPSLSAKRHQNWCLFCFLAITMIFRLSPSLQKLWSNAPGLLEHYSKAAGATFPRASVKSATKLPGFNNR